MAKKHQKGTVMRRGGPRKTAPVDFNFSFTSLAFPSQGDDRFRLTSTTTKDGLQLKLENKSTHQAWQLTISDLAEYGPGGLPKEVVFGILKSAVEQCVQQTEEQIDGAASIDSKPSAQPLVDFETSTEGINMFLDIPFGGVSITYSFPLLPIAQEIVDILEARLKDAQEEIIGLKKSFFEFKKALLEPTCAQFICLRTSTAAPNGGFVAWNVEVNNTSPNLFEKTTDHTTVIVKKTGFFAVNVRVCLVDSGNQGRCLVIVNGQTVTGCYMGDNANYNKSSIINDLVRLEQGVQVQVYFNNSHWVTAGFNTFSIQALN